MKYLKKLLKVTALMLVLTMLSTVLPIHPVAEAATVKLNKKTLTLVVGKSETLKITGTKAKVTWASSNKKVATVSTGGKVTGKKEGKATITATVNKKKYSCAVTVKKAEVSFTTQEAVLGTIKFKYPKNWTNMVMTDDGNNAMSVLYPGSTDTFGETSYMAIVISETDEPQPDFTDVKATMDGIYSEDAIEETIKSQLNMASDLTISDIKTGEFKAALGTAYVLEYTVSYKVEALTGTMQQSVYALFIDNYMFLLTSIDMGDGKELGLKDIAEYIVNSIEVVK
jgi:hypothetical protein